MEGSSNAFLLSTKLKIPAPRKDYVVRRMLFEKLSQCTDMSVIFVRGGAGTGKTTLLSTFIRETGLEKVCWMSIDSTNANVYSFWVYFTAAVHVFWEEDDSFLNLMQANPDASHMENLLIMLINRLCSEEDYYMVLDDIHCIRDAALIRTFEFFIKSMPPNFHLFLLSREDPPVYLGPIAVSGRLLYIDGSQMQLTQEEGLVFLTHTMKLSASEEELNQLNTYAEGWIGGLQLAAAANVIGKNSGQLLRAGGGIATEYLTREVLESLTLQERDFLAKTGYLSYFDWEICSQIWTQLSKPEFDFMIEGLIEKNLFIICVDEQTGVYRYHNILSEYLTQQFIRLSELDKKEIYIKPAEAFIKRGDYEEALREYCLVGDYEGVLRTAHTMEGRIEAWSYLDQVPIEILIQDAELAAQCFMYNLGNMDMERCRVIFEKFKEHYGDTEIFNIVRFVEIYITKGTTRLPKYYVMPIEQIELLHFGPVAKAMLLVENSAALMELMKYEEAEECIQKAIKLCDNSNVFVDFYAYNQLAQIYEEVGRLKDSLLCYEKSKDIIMIPSMLTGIGTNYYFGLAGVYMRRMEMERAKETLEQCRLLMEKEHIHLDITDLTLAHHLAELNFLQGDADKGTIAVEEFRSRLNYNILSFSRLIHELDCADRLDSNLADSFLSELEKADNYKQQPFMRLIYARIIFRRGKYEEALRETEEILKFSRLHHNKLHLVNAALLKLYMICNMEEQPAEKRKIYNLLREAIHYAQEDCIIMPFYLERIAILPLLRQFADQMSGRNDVSIAEADFIKRVIEICTDTVSISKEEEVLSARELEVLAEMSLGITNREIADQLHISLSTVKTHVLSIYGKLGVSSRMMAVDKGRKEGLILDQRS